MITQLIGASPAAGAVIIVVIIFIRYVKTKDLDFREMHDRNMRTIDRNSEVLGKTCAHMDELIRQLRDRN